MYLHQFSVSGRVETYSNINFAPDVDEQKVDVDQGDHFPGIYVIQGGQGEGKTAALKVIALGLIGPEQANNVGNVDGLESRLSEKIEVRLHYFWRRSGGGRQLTKSAERSKDKRPEGAWQHQDSMQFKGGSWTVRQAYFDAISNNPWKRSGMPDDYFSLSYPFKIRPKYSTVRSTSLLRIERCHPLLFGSDWHNPESEESSEHDFEVFVDKCTSDIEVTMHSSPSLSGVVLIDDFGHSMDDESAISLSKALTAEYPKLQFIVSTESKAFKNSVPEKRRFQVRRDGDRVILERP